MHPRFDTPGRFAHLPGANARAPIRCFVPVCEAVR